MDIKQIIVAAIALLLVGFFLANQFGFLTAFQEGASMPLTGEIILSVDGRTAVFGEPLKVIRGETVKAEWRANWFNRNFSFVGNALLAANWYVDNTFSSMMPGSTQSVMRTQPGASAPGVGEISNFDWDWKTLEFVAQQPAEGQSVDITQTKSFPTTNLEAGLHTIDVRAKLLSGASNQQDVFSCSGTIGACCPIQTVSQGFPCTGIYGTTTVNNRSDETTCPVFNLPGYDGISICEGGFSDDITCKNTCCSDDFGASYSIYYIGSPVKKYVKCEAFRMVYGGWTSAITVERSFDEAFEDNKAGDIVAVAEFKVVELCPFECCINEPDYIDSGCDLGNCVNRVCEDIEIPGIPSPDIIPEDGFVWPIDALQTLLLAFVIVVVIAIGYLGLR